MSKPIANKDFKNNKNLNVIERFIEKLEKCLSETKKVVLYGVAGVGKTAIAKQVSRRLMSTHNVFWLDCETVDKFKNSLKEADNLITQDMTTKNDNFVTYLQNCAFKTLIVLDNLDDYGICHEFVQNLPENVCLFATTRDPKLNQNLCTIHFEGFTKTDVQSLISTKLAKLNKKDLNKLMNTLFMFSDHISMAVISNLYKFLEANDILKKEKFEFNENSPFILDVVLQNIKEKSNDAWTLLAHIAYLNGEAISFGILKEIFGRKVSEIKEIVKVLVSNSVVSLTEHVSMSRLNQEKCKTFIEASDKGLQVIVLNKIACGLRSYLLAQRVNASEKKQICDHFLSLMNFEAKISDRELLKDLFWQTGAFEQFGALKQHFESEESRAPGEEKKQKVFVFFHGNDYERAVKICDYLKSKNEFNVLLDEKDSNAAKGLYEKMAEKVLEADLVICCKSNDFIGSEIERKVMQYAKIGDKKVISVYFGDAQVDSEVALMMRANDEQWSGILGFNLLLMINRAFEPELPSGQLKIGNKILSSIILFIFSILAFLFAFIY